MNWLRNQAGQGLSVLRSLTEASSINFVSTNAVQDTLLARLQDEMERAMEAENYDLANQCKRDISLLLLPSQQSQRAQEHGHVREQAEQLRGAVPRNAGVLQALAKQSWHRSVLNSDDLSFAPTTPDRFKLQGAIAPPSPSTPTAIGVLGSAVQGSLQDATQQMHLCLAAEPPAVARAAECALYIISLVAESEVEAEIEIASACIDKVSSAARQELTKQIHAPLYLPPDPLWRNQARNSL